MGFARVIHNDKRIVESLTSRNAARAVLAFRDFEADLGGRKNIEALLASLFGVELGILSDSRGATSALVNLGSSSIVSQLPQEYIAAGAIATALLGFVAWAWERHRDLGSPADLFKAKKDWDSLIAEEQEVLCYKLERRMARLGHDCEPGSARRFLSFLFEEDQWRDLPKRVAGMIESQESLRERIKGVDKRYGDQLEGVFVRLRHIEVELSELRQEVSAHDWHLREHDGSISDLNTRVDVAIKSLETIAQVRTTVDSIQSKADDIRAKILFDETTPRSSAEWNRVGTSLGPDEKILVGRERVDRLQCFRKAIEIDPDNARAWGNLGVELWSRTSHVNVGGRDYGPKECNIRALDLDSRLSWCWSNLSHQIGTDERVAIGKLGVFNERECTLMAHASDLDPEDSSAWTTLGEEMRSHDRVPVGNQDYSRRECHVRALELDPNNARGWRNLAEDILWSGDLVPVAGKDYSATECAIKAVSLDLQDEQAWRTLGTVLDKGKTAIVLGKRYSFENCWLRAAVIAAEKFPHSYRVWYWLGDNLKGNKKVVVDGETMTRRACFLRAIEHGATSRQAWLHLAKDLVSSEKVAVNGHNYSRQDCLRSAKKANME